MAVPTESYEKIDQSYSDALAWMNYIGVKFSSGRTSHYAKVIKYWKSEYKSAAADTAKAAFPGFVSSMFEVHDFIEIWKAFSQTPTPELSQLVEKLQKGINGPIDASDETSNSTTARNFLFEAMVAARSHRPQIGVEAILNTNSDTGIKIDKKKLWIECKRPITTNKIEANVRKASSQLEAVIKKQMVQVIVE